MNFNKHYELKNKHAFLSASNYHWLNYDEEKLRSVWEKMKAKELGTRLHALAAEHIELGIKLPRNHQTLNMYVNDAIGFGMTPEQPLYYSDNCFGTADAILFKSNKLRIHDLKTGSSPVSFNQLYIYTALFCLEYAVEPKELDDVELRIYQNDDVLLDTPTPEDIDDIMALIKRYDYIIEECKAR